VTIIERRRALRLPPLPAGYQSQAIVRPGHYVHLLNLASGGALVEGHSRLRPGAFTELQVFRGQARLSLPASISRCRVSRLAPLMYEAALRFDVPLDVTGAY